MFVRKMLTGLTLAAATVAPVAVVNVAPAHAAPMVAVYTEAGSTGTFAPPVLVVRKGDTITIVTLTSESWNTSSPSITQTGTNAFRVEETAQTTGEYIKNVSTGALLRLVVLPA